MKALRAALPIAFGLLATTGAMAQFADPNIALVGPSGAITCRDFTLMSSHQREVAVRRFNGLAPAMSLATPLPGIGAPMSKSEQRSSAKQATVTPLTAAAVVSACQAASASENMRGADSSANSGVSTAVSRG